VELTKTAEGRVSIETESLKESWRISLLLMFRYGFFRWGIYIPPITDEAIHPNFVRFNLKICAGWDNWSCYYFFADNPQTDSFLLKFYNKHSGKYT
jgi:hypothetical protein